MAMRGATASASPVPAGAPPVPVGASPAPASAASPAERQALLAYEATVTVGVYQVTQAMDTVMDIARKAGGHVVLREDYQIAFRVPRGAFETALRDLDGVGDILHRDVRAEDVSDQYRDLNVRLRNARAMRDRLEQLLVRANTVEDSLKIEAQLSRITEEIERLSGSLALLGHRVDFSRITVVFQVRHSEHVKDVPHRLPFHWLETLGLPTLLQLEEKS